MTTLSVDQTKCIGCGACVSSAPELFEMTDGKAKAKISDISEDKKQQAEGAVGICPVQAISLQ